MQTVDILIYIALSEEFNYLVDDLLGDSDQSFISQEMEDYPLTIFYGNIFCKNQEKYFHTVIIPAGKMGNTRAATVTSAILAKSSVCDVIVLGIAGSLSNDLQPGDVLIPDSVEEYLANSAAIGEDNNWEFKTSGNNLPTSLRLLNRFQHFFSRYRPIYDQWLKDSNDRLNHILENKKIQEILDKHGEELRSDVKLFAGDDKKLASGPAVGKGKAFTDWLKNQVDRKFFAIDMESSGVYDAVNLRIPSPRVIAFRGISDFADERKQLIEDTVREQFREVSLKNAFHLLLHGIESGLFNPDIVESSGSNNVESEDGQKSLQEKPEHIDKKVKEVKKFEHHKEVYRFAYSSKGMNKGNYAAEQLAFKKILG